jgi:hypothetical protein
MDRIVLARRGLDMFDSLPRAPPAPARAGAIIEPVPAKVPWLPATLPPGARPERCLRCGRQALIPWTLRRDDRTKTVLRTWVCTECQLTVERPEPE